MKCEGILDKMLTSLGETVNYQLVLGGSTLQMNELIGQQVRLTFTGKIFCLSCGKSTRSSFGQGFCYHCFQTAPEADECILHPEKCKAHLGLSRNMEWSQQHCLTPHVVYLSNTSHLKVGVTRLSQMPTRWIDQGASQAIQLALTPNRHTAGIIEVFLKAYYSDKTNWKHMLFSRGTPDLDLVTEKKQAYTYLPVELQQYFSDNDQITHIHYPIGKLLDSLTSTTFDKQKVIEGILTGIKGQYVIFDHSTALNIRSSSGYQVLFECQ